MTKSLWPRSSIRAAYRGSISRHLFLECSRKARGRSLVNGHRVTVFARRTSGLGRGPWSANQVRAGSARSRGWAARKKSICASPHWTERKSLIPPASRPCADRRNKWLRTRRGWSAPPNSWEIQSIRRPRHASQPSRRPVTAKSLRSVCAAALASAYTPRGSEP